MDGLGSQPDVLFFYRGARFGDAHGLFGRLDDFILIQPIGGGEAPRPIGDHPDAEPQGFVLRESAQYTVARGDGFHARVDDANIRVGRSSRLCRI